MFPRLGIDFDPNCWNFVFFNSLYNPVFLLRSWVRKSTVRMEMNLHFVPLGPLYSIYRGVILLSLNYQVVTFSNSRTYSPCPPPAFSSSLPLRLPRVTKTAWKFINNKSRPKLIKLEGFFLQGQLCHIIQRLALLRLSYIYQRRTILKNPCHQNEWHFELSENKVRMQPFLGSWLS